MLSWVNVQVTVHYIWGKTLWSFWLGSFFIPSMWECWQLLLYKCTECIKKSTYTLCLNGHKEPKKLLFKVKCFRYHIKSKGKIIIRTLFSWMNILSGSSLMKGEFLVVNKVHLASWQPFPTILWWVLVVISAPISSIIICSERSESVLYKQISVQRVIFLNTCVFFVM